MFSNLPHPGDDFCQFSEKSLKLLAIKGIICYNKNSSVIGGEIFYEY